jgi:hypothetical protein
MGVGTDLSIRCIYKNIQAEYLWMSLLIAVGTKLHTLNLNTEVKRPEKIKQEA